MTRSALPLPLLLALTGAAPAQVEFTATGTLVVQCPVGDLVLNGALLQALLGEPACLERMRRDLTGLHVQTTTSTMPAGQPAGTYQLDLYLEGEHATALSATDRERVVAAAVAHLRERLDAMLYEEPREQLTTRRSELQRRHRELLAEQAMLQAKSADGRARSELARRRCADAEAQVVAADLEVATEQRARDLLARLRADQGKQDEEIRRRRDALVEEKSVLLRRRAQLQEESHSLENNAAHPDKDAERKRLQAALAAVEVASGTIERAIDDTNGRANEVCRMTTVVLEQVPVNAIALERAMARRDSLRSLLDAARQGLAAADEERVRAATLEAESERLGIDVAVTKTLLLEIEGKLARLQPVQYRLLHARQ